MRQAHTHAHHLQNRFKINIWTLQFDSGDREMKAALSLMYNVLASRGIYKLNQYDAHG